MKSFPERTVGTYMHQMGIVPSGQTMDNYHKDSDFSTELQNILDEQFNPDRPNAEISLVFRISPTSGQ